MVMHGSAEWPKEAAETFWRRRAKVSALRANLAWLLTLFMPLLLGLSALFACYLLICRKLGQPEHDLAWPALCGAIAAALFLSLVRARRRFVGEAQALVRLETAMGLNARLSAASSGVGQWPKPDAAASDGLSWRWAYLASPALVSLFLLAGAALVPVSADIELASSRAEPPLSVTEVEAWLEKLAESSIVEKRSLEEFRDQLEKLKPQSNSEWYNHNSLEAADNLKRKTGHAMEELAQNLAQAEALLSEAEKAAQEGLSSTEQSELRSELAQTLKELSNGQMALEAPGLGELSKQAEAGELSPEMAKKLMEELKGKERALSEMLRPGQKGAHGKQGSGQCSGQAGGAPMCAQPDGVAGGSGQGEGDPSAEAGSASISRGPGTAPLDLKEKAPQITSNLVDALPRQESDSTEIGQRIGTSSRAPDLNSPPDAQSAGGGASGDADGGYAVWKDAVLPSERAVLKRYFK